MALKVDRRTFLGSGTAAALSILVPGKWALAQDARGATHTAAVQTGSGRVRGLVRYGINQFFNVPYGASTAGVNRFMPPVKPAPWTGVKDCFEVGQRSPQDEGGPISEVFAM